MTDPTCPFSVVGLTLFDLRCVLPNSSSGLDDDRKFRVLGDAALSMIYRSLVLPTNGLLCVITLSRTSLRCTRIWTALLSPFLLLEQHVTRTLTRLPLMLCRKAQPLQSLRRTRRIMPLPYTPSREASTCSSPSRQRSLWQITWTWWRRARSMAFTSASRCTSGSTRRTLLVIRRPRLSETSTSSRLTCHNQRPSSKHLLLGLAEIAVRSMSKGGR